MLEVREVDAEEEVQVPAQYDVDQENVTEEIADAVSQPTLPLPPSPVVAASTSISAAKPAVVAVSTPISAAKLAAKPKVLKIVAAAPAVSTRKRSHSH
nr:hypothetical protein [Tanacetum cinerariifolium]